MPLSLEGQVGEGRQVEREVGEIDGIVGIDSGV